MEKKTELDAPLPPSRIEWKAFTHVDYTEDVKKIIIEDKYPARKKKFANSKVNERLDHERLCTLLTVEGINSYDYVDRLIENNITLKSLAALTLEDLELVGLTDRKKCEELLESCKLVPNQNPSYESFINRPEVKQYGDEIFDKANAQLHAMDVALKATNYKMQLQPPEDYLISEKYFASHTVLNALDALDNLTVEAEKELASLKKVLKSQDAKERPKSRLPSLNFILLNLLCLGAFSAFMLFKLTK